MGIDVDRVLKGRHMFQYIYSYKDKGRYPVINSTGFIARLCLSNSNIVVSKRAIETRADLKENNK